MFCAVDDEDKLTDIADVLCMYKQVALPYSVYAQFKKTDRRREVTVAEEVKQYAGFVGGKCAQRMLLYRR